MSFTVDQIMERVGSREPQRIIEYIREAFIEMALLEGKGITTTKINIVEGKIDYPIPDNAIAVHTVSVLDTANASEILEQTNRDFSGTNNWTNTNFLLFNTIDDLSITNDQVDQSGYLDVDALMTIGKNYRLEYDCILTSGTFELQAYTNSTKYGDFENGTSKVIEFAAVETDKLKIVGTSSSGVVTFDNFSLKEMGIDKYRRANRIIGELIERWDDWETK